MGLGPVAEPFILVPGKLSLADLRRLGDGAARVALDPECLGAIEASADVVARLAAGEERVYGINTGFGSLAGTAIPADQVA